MANLSSKRLARLHEILGAHIHGAAPGPVSVVSCSCATRDHPRFPDRRNAAIDS
ncbi:MAG TPA: hypothetical protein VLD86_03805 [Ilumatobacteraceae bacterium]|nr:hypothetical protein [Ilumatobacteraceae bacterium]